MAFGFPAQNIWVVLVGTILGGAGIAFTNPAQIAALNQTPLAQRGMVAGIFPMVGQFGTALWVALLTAGLSAFMAQNAAAGEAAAQADALGTLSWIIAGVTLVVLLVALMLRNTPATPAPTPTPAKQASK